MDNKYINIEIKVSEEFKDIVSAVLQDFPMLGIVDHDFFIIVSFNEVDLTDEVLKNLTNQIQSISSDIAIGEYEEISEQNWNLEWEKNIPSIQINDRIGIAPDWKMDQIHGEILITINPKMSFGTGNHETTRLCCLLLEKYLNQNETWIDAGTGTGVLSILAIKLGAKSVFAFDNNEWAIENTHENILLNKVKDDVEVAQLDLDETILSESDGIVANILAHVLNRNMNKFYSSLKNGKFFIASGILLEQEMDVIASAKNVGFELVETLHMNDWTGIVFKKP